MGRTLWQLLLRLAKRIGKVQSWLLLTVFYFVIVGPVAVLFRFCRDPLHLRPGPSAIWKTRAPSPRRVEWGRQQF